MLNSLRRGFDPDEPRDDAGKWTDGGGSDGGSSGDGGGGGASLTTAERDKLEDWTQGEPKSGAYNKMRTDPKMIALMEKLPKQAGVVYRGTAFTKGKIGNTPVGKLEDLIGKTYSISKLSSSSTDGAKAAEFAATDVISPTTGDPKKGWTAIVFKMEQKNGRALPEKIGGVEKEVVLMPKTNFQITAIRDAVEQTNGVPYKEITMREI